MAVLEGVGVDLHDLYYIARPIVRRPYQKSVAVWYSAVGGCEGLKQYLPEDMHAGLLNTAAMNVGLPEKFTMKLDTGEEMLDYDPETHPQLLRKLREEDRRASMERASIEDLTAGE
jgi:hypothetical protein